MYEDVYKQEREKQKLMQQMLLQSMTPDQNQMVSGRVVPYSPWQGMSKIGQALIARSAIDESEDRLTAAKKEREQSTKDIIATAMGSPAVPAETAPLLGPEEFGGGMEELSPTQPAVPGDPQKAMLMAAANNPAMAKVMSAITKQGRGQYFTPEQVFTEDGRIVTRILNRRTGELMSVGPKEPISPKDPKAKAAVKRAEITAKAEAERTFGMAGLGETIDEARHILTTGKPTGSGVGAAADWIARQVGSTSPSAQQAAQLEAIGGALTSKMPRMEGPQSDFDRLNYEKMAARVGDRNIPIKERLLALDSMEKIWRKYETGQSAPARKEPEVLRFDAQGNRL